MHWHVRPRGVGPTIDRLAELIAPAERSSSQSEGPRRCFLGERGYPSTGSSSPVDDRPAAGTRRRRENSVIVGDMANARAPGEYSWSTSSSTRISNLLTQPNSRLLPERGAPLTPAAASLSSCGCLSCASSRRDASHRLAFEPGYIGLDTHVRLQQQVVSHHFLSAPASRHSSFGARTATSGRLNLT